MILILSLIFQAEMVVVQEPFKNEIIGLKDSYEVGELVKGVCYSRGSSPTSELTWRVNHERVSKGRKKSSP